LQNGGFLLVRAFVVIRGQMAAPLAYAWPTAIPFYVFVLG